MTSQYDCGSRSEFKSGCAPACAAVCFEPLEGRQLLAATLDDVFGDGGVVKVEPVTMTFAVAPDDKIVTAGGRAVSRRTRDGAPDPSFGGGDGTIDTDFGVIRGVAVQQDGKVVVVGEKSRKGGGSVFRVARYTSAGKPDQGFSGDGVFTKSFGGKPAWDFASDVVIQPDGKTVVVGRGTTARRSNSGALVIMRLKANGRLDRTFNSKGFSAKRNLGSLHYEGLDVELAPEGKIVVGGSDGGAIVVRSNRDGSFDRTFGGGDGVAETQVTFWSLSLDVQQDGKVVFSGASKESMADWGDRVVRLTASGELDPSFGGGDGIVQDLFEVHDAYSSTANDVLVLPDSDILVSGENEDRATDIERATLTRLNPDGSIDGEFAGGERYGEIPFGRRAHAHDLELQSDGRVVVGGSNSRGRKLARYIIDEVG